MLEGVAMQVLSCAAVAWPSNYTVCLHSHSARVNNCICSTQHEIVEKQYLVSILCLSTGVNS